MNLSTICIRNFRRLKDVCISVDKEKTIFVGANNSGKTSSTHILQLFLGSSRDKFSIFDFNYECWDLFDVEIEKRNKNPEYTPEFPKITLDLWFDIEENDLHLVLDLLPGLNWKKYPLGVRLQFAPKDPYDLIKNYSTALEKANSLSKEKEGSFKPWPKSLKEYLSKQITNEYTIFYYTLDKEHFNKDLKEISGYTPQQLGTKEKSGAKILSSIIKVDFLHAQRHLSDTTGRDGDSTGRSENLSKRFTRFYKKNLTKYENNFDAIKALANSEDQLTAHFSTVFKTTMDRLKQLIYPGFSNPNLVIKAVLNPDNIMTQNAELHYTLDLAKADTHILPDRYNGLGFKNLIYMILELIDFQEQWITDEDPALLHLIVIEEPEAHLHSQLQQVFIKKIIEVLVSGIPKDGIFNSQMIVTTHSPHIIYESGFNPIRYFRRSFAPNQASEVLNLSSFKSKSDDFLHQYMKLTHCDLFFADAAILVEGNVERLLIPLMIDKVAPELKSQYLSILEIGGAYAFCFKELIDFLGCTTLIITDLDSISTKENEENIDESDKENLPEGTFRKKCKPSEDGAITSNQTLIQWIPKITEISKLLNATEGQKIIGGKDSATVRVCYQTIQEVSLEQEKTDVAARTLEEAFAHKNLAWTQDEKNKNLKLKVTSKTTKDLNQVLDKIYTRVKGSYFNKSVFALELMKLEKQDWVVPTYIEEGLVWLKKILVQDTAITTIDSAQITQKVGKPKKAKGSKNVQQS